MWAQSRPPSRELLQFFSVPCPASTRDTACRKSFVYSSKIASKNDFAICLNEAEKKNNLWEYQLPRPSLANCFHPCAPAFSREPCAPTASLSPTAMLCHFCQPPYSRNHAWLPLHHWTPSWLATDHLPAPRALHANSLSPKRLSSTIFPGCLTQACMLVFPLWPLAWQSYSLQP